jgi:TRAP transporter TAXI family solute receptor
MNLIKIIKSSFVFLASITATFLLLPSNSFAVNKFVTIGTGNVTGVYYPTGGAICRLVNRGRRDHGIRCSVESTNGSVFNINSLRRGEMDLAVAQSDWQYHAYKGSVVPSFIAQGPFEDLRSLFSLHTEAFTIVVKDDSGINSLDDLVNKRVNIGEPGSGIRATMEVVMKSKGWTYESFKVASELKASEQPQALCDNKIDVMIYNVGHPNGAVQEAATSCNVKIIPVIGPEIDKLVKERSYYAYTTIPGGMYANNPNDIKTFGGMATFVTNKNVDEEVIYQVVRSVFKNFDSFKTLHPVFANLEKEKLIKDGNTAPLHKGAIRFYKEENLL